MIRHGLRSALGCLLPALVLTGAAVADDPGETVSLRWALGARVDQESALTAIQRDTELGAGSKLKFLVEPTSPSSVYLVLLDAGGSIEVLYRAAPAKVESDGKPTYIPPGRQWFELDDSAGLETFFLLASAEPLARLEKLLDGYQAADAAARKGLADGIVTEIRDLQKASRNFARPVEKPVMIGGRTRGAPEDADEAIDRLAMDVSAERFYSKTITIDH